MNLNGLTGKVITPCDSEYPILRLEYNRDINKFPLAIVYCYDAIDVSNAIKWCKRNAPPPFLYAWNGNRHKLPSPIAAPAAAKIKPFLLFQFSLIFIFPLF